MNEAESWEEAFLWSQSITTTLCECQQRNVPAENGCAFCEGDGTRNVEVRRNGQARRSMGVYGWGEWKTL